MCTRSMIDGLLKATSPSAWAKVFTGLAYYTGEERQFQIRTFF